MKVLRVVIATNQINRKNSVFTDSSLEDAAKQINISDGIPQLHSHDWTRLLGWTVRAWTERRGKVLELVVETHCPETTDEYMEVEKRYTQYWKKQQDEKTRPFLEYLSSDEHSGCSLISDLSCVYIKGSNILFSAFDTLSEKLDDDRLLLLDRFVPVGDGFIESGQYLLVPHRCFRQSYSLCNHLNSEFFGALARAKRNHPNLKIRLRLDEHIVGIPESLEKYEELDYWWGPKYKEDPNKIDYGVTVHGPTKYDVMYGRLKQTEFWWYGKEKRTFEMEEVLEYPTRVNVAEGAKVGMRFIHSIFDPETKRPFHLDGAVRLYEDDLFEIRKYTTINKFGKNAIRLKLWQIDGDMSVENWFTLINTFFLNNFTIAEYFGINYENMQ